MICVQKKPSHDCATSITLSPQWRHVQFNRGAAMNTLNQIIIRIERFAQDIADVLLFAIMVIVFFDVLLRYLFNSPLFWAYDVISLYLMAAVFFLSLSSAYSAHCHIGIDILVQTFSKNGQRLAEIFACLLAIPFFALVITVGTERAYNHWINGDAISGLIAWPTWIGAALVPIGCLLLVIRLVFRLIGHIASIVSGRDVIELLSAGATELRE